MKIIKYLIIFITFLLSQNLFAEEIKKNMKIYEGKWIVNCISENEKECALERSIFLDEQKKRKLITIIMQTKPPSKNVRFVLISPLGTLIPLGVKIGFDGKFISEKGYAFNICRKLGCITSMMVKKETLEKFKKADNLSLEYVGANGQKININFSLNGFDKEFKKITIN
tara:strand:+ start:375 stop:881 length:507 start_codon:yes stop_codon:yes gene_type:complete